MSDFSLYFQLGFEHISDLNGYDHMLFLLALCAFYRWADYKKMLWLVTAFTLGHSLSLGFSVASQLKFDTSLIETLIPVTILLTALFNLFFHGFYDRKEDSQTPQNNVLWPKYAVAGFFGLIHGLGFSSYLRALLGQEESVLIPLAGFNIGLEIGQLGIVFVFMSINTLTFRIMPRFRWWPFISSGVAAGWSVFMIFQ